MSHMLGVIVALLFDATIFIANFQFYFIIWKVKRLLFDKIFLSNSFGSISKMFIFPLNIVRLLFAFDWDVGGLFDYNKNLDDYNWDENSIAMSWM